MSFKPSKRRRYHLSGHELNITPIMNIFIIIIPFLLLTVVFAKTAIIDIYLPQEVHAEALKKTDSIPEILTIKVTEKGFELGGIGEGVFIARSENNLDYRQLTEELVKIKDKYPQKDEAILLFTSSMSYDTVIKSMDATRETSDSIRRTLFPLVSLGEAEEDKPVEPQLKD